MRRVPLVLLVIMTAAPAHAQRAADNAGRHAQHTHPAVPVTPLFEQREVSGTAWLPDETPMHGRERRWRGWQVMLHGNAFAQLLYEPGDRHRTGGVSTTQLGGVNWGMLTARRPVGPARLGLRAMVSLEPWTVPGCGYLSLLATGEVCEGDTIHDRQHPHDLFMELAADYDRPITGSWRWHIYGGLSGEPALGPAGFPHRLSAQLNPIAPIGHHWLDATHISFGLVTAAVYNLRWKGDLSVFNGREPDEHRADLDLAPLDSFSGRITVLPTPRLALQASAAHLREAEAGVGGEPPTSVARFTASATYHQRIGPQRFWATTLAYGVNSERKRVVFDELDAVTQALMLETTLEHRDRHTWFWRAEVVQMPAHDLHAHEFPLRIFTTGKLQLGYVRHFRARRGLEPGLGGMVSASLVAPELSTRYGGRVAPGFGLFLNLRPVRHLMGR